MSYLNPAKRTMSVLNLALQNVALQREKMPPGYEIMAKGKTLKGLRDVAQRNVEFKGKYCESIEVPICILKKRFSKQKCKGESIIVHDAAIEEEIETLVTTMLAAIDEDVEIDKLAKLKSPKIDHFLAKHARCCHFIFQVNA